MDDTKDAETHGSKQQEKDEESYPSAKVVFPAMVALYLVVFLVALVSQIEPRALQTSILTLRLGSNHSWYSSPCHIQRIQ